MSSSPLSCWSDFRKNGIKSAKTLFSTGGDIASDWLYYLRITQGGEAESYEFYLFIVCCISSVMGLLLVISLIMNRRQNREKAQLFKRRSGGKFLKFDSFSSMVKSLLMLEIFLEDIPQFVLTTLITKEVHGELTNYAVFNITFSAVNLVFNLFDMIELDDEDQADTTDAAADSSADKGLSYRNMN